MVILTLLRDIFKDNHYFNAFVNLSFSYSIPVNYQVESRIL